MRIRRYFKCLCCVLILFMFWTLISYLISFKDEDFPEDVAYDIFVDETKDEHVHIPLDQEIHEELQNLRHKNAMTDLKDPKVPIILWWTEFTKDPGTERSCGNNKCFFTNNRQYSKHKNLKTFLFYGTDFRGNDLPLPRSEDHIWALLHEESPKNNFLLCHDEVLSLFNYTSTFRQESDFPITTQYLVSLEWLQQMTYYKTVSQKNKYQKEEKLAPVIYVQSDCDTPSDRDEFVKLLMKYISVDSYGACINNRQLPTQINQPLSGMSHKDYFELISHYKFALAMENAVCPDYITEKLWRPLMVGTVPIIFGSSRAQDFLPSNNSAIILENFKSAEHLGAYLGNLNAQDDKYEVYRTWKSNGISNDNLRNVMRTRTWGPTSDSHWTPGYKNFIEEYECYLCQKIYEMDLLKSQGSKPPPKTANLSHYGCPKPLKFDSMGRYNKEGGWQNFWSGQWMQKNKEGVTLKSCVSKGKNYCGSEKKVGNVKKDF
ncbi:alpha-(1 3)-fucosyltransferase 10 [Biomphalaria glabrata]|nr:alpha 1-3-fucosyltransferase 10-like [Biomphalaria glabrata]